MKADLHIHSYYSDGTYDIKKIVKYAKEKGLDIISLTDHDSVRGVKEAIDEGIKHNLKVIPGIEFSTYNNGESVHILGYFLGSIPQKILDYSNYMYHSRCQRALKIAENLMKLHNLNCNLERLMNQKGMITRSHLVKEFQLSNPKYTSEEIFNNFLHDDAPGYIPSTKMGTKEGIELLKSCNALVIIAHPALLKKNDILELISLGVDGIEAIYPKNIGNMEEEFRQIAQKNDIIITAGSDFHGVIDYAHPDMAYNVLEGQDLIKFLERLGAKNEN